MHLRQIFQYLYYIAIASNVDCVLLNIFERKNISKHKIKDVKFTEISKRKLNFYWKFWGFLLFFIGFEIFLKSIHIDKFLCLKYLIIRNYKPSFTQPKQKKYEVRVKKTSASSLVHYSFT